MNIGEPCVADGFRTFETIHRRKDGSTFPVEITVNYLEYRDKGFTVSFARNISERKLAEEQLETEKAAVGGVEPHLAPEGQNGSREKP